ncbi:Flp pilus assembly protein CpaB [Pseudoruminococcus massiliensis]|uniref:Flp pilus assembly protein CpaB n=1 Tax=Pseudoruminococcus massiliensis TaxID=2086583 RepID=UPI00307C78C5
MKNRTAIGIVCIILAVVITFVVSPMVNKVSDKKTETVRFTTNVTHGTKIKETDVEVVKISNSALPDKVVKNKTAVIGKYATADLFKGDFATENKVTDNANTASDVMASLKGNKVAMSITINSFAGGLSGKLQNGDVVSICVTGKDNKAEIPAELKYVKVITTTTSGGVDENDVVENEDGSFDLPTTITVLVSVEQARILANYEKNAAMHIVLVYRGDDASAEKFLKAQDEYLEKNSRNGG